MCRNKKMLAVLLGFAMAISLMGCKSSAKLVTDTGSGKQQEVAKEDYLKIDIPKQQEETVDNHYQVHTLTIGIFEERAITQSLKRSYINVPTVRLDVDGLEACFGEYIADSMQYVEEGDVIATVHTEVDEIAIEEARLKLQRLEERYQAAESQMIEDLEAIIAEKDRFYKDFDKKIEDIHYKQRQLDWEYEKYNYESRIEAVKEEINKLTEIGKIYEVTANTAGYVEYRKEYYVGEDIEDGDYICHIMKANEVYVVTDVQAEQFYYGMNVEFDGRNGLIPGKVVNGGSWALYGNLNPDMVIFKLTLEDDISQLDKSGFNNLKMDGNLKTVKNVVLVPKKAVEVQNKEYFVTLLKEDGTFLKTEFIPGGSNDEFYWVLNGLTEGMQVIYN